MGKIFRILLNNNVNWGYFTDHHPWGFHCNAHMNNFAVLPPSM